MVSENLHSVDRSTVSPVATTAPAARRDSPNTLFSKDLLVVIRVKPGLARSLECVCRGRLHSTTGRRENELSQRIVEQIIGKLVTDEGFRARFAQDPGTAITEVARCGCGLTAYEHEALLRLDPARFDRFAEALDPSLVRVDLSGGMS